MDDAAEVPGPEIGLGRAAAWAGFLGVLLCLAALPWLAGEPAWWWAAAIPAAGLASAGTAAAIGTWLPEPPDDRPQEGEPAVGPEGAFVPG